MRCFSILLVLLFFASCASRKQVPQPKKEGIRIDTYLPISGPSLSIGHGLTMGQHTFRPYRKTVRDEATGTELTLSVDNDGFVEADCVSPPDTVKITQKIYVPDPVPYPCPEPVNPESGNPFFRHILFFLAGFFAGKFTGNLNPKKLYDRLKTFLSAWK